MAYTPGVAKPASAIAADPAKAYDYTGKGSLVAVISNGTAVLGLGNIGPLGAKPVMEGKAMLIHRLTGLNSYDIELKETDPQKLAYIIESLSPTFGAINLEDIKSPECFEVEKTLTERLDIPVIHDDQHGTAIVVSAALSNALFLTKKRLDSVQIVVYGAGAGGLATVKLLHAMGAKKENIIMFDSKGVVHEQRADLPAHKAPFATQRSIAALAEAMQGADIFLGFSVGNIVKPTHLMAMASNPIVFAMANPTPEIDPSLAKRTREDLILGTGRSDYPNQINNVLVFPYLYRGLLDVRATKFTDGIKIAAVEALASLGRTPVSEQAKGRFDAQHLLPHAMDKRLLTKISAAVASAAMKEGLACTPIKDWKAYHDQLEERMQKLFP